MKFLNVSHVTVGIGACDDFLSGVMGLAHNDYWSDINWFILFTFSEETVMLYDPSGNSEDGIIVLLADNKDSDDDVFITEWDGHGGITLQQENDMICLDACQIEELYSILKHNL
jgi:hypothetical protein